MSDSKGRLTHFGSIHYQAPNRKPATISLKFDRDLSGSEQAYERQGLLAPDDWTEIDVGWCKDRLAAVVVQNRPDSITPIFLRGKLGGGLVLMVMPGEGQYLSLAPGEQGIEIYSPGAAGYNLMAVPE